MREDFDFEDYVDEEEGIEEEYEYEDLDDDEFDEEYEDDEYEEDEEDEEEEGDLEDMSDEGFINVIYKNRSLFTKLKIIIFLKIFILLKSIWTINFGTIVTSMQDL